MTLGSSHWLRATWLGFGLAAGSHAVHAQSAPTDSAAIWSLQDENASLSPSRVTDRYYVNGFRLGYASPEGDVPGPLARLAGALWDGGAVRLTVGLSQQIYTPDATNLAVPPQQDHPYAGVLLGTVGLVRDGADSRSTLGLSLGLVGPDALAEQVQNGFHDIIGQGHTNGWHAQIHDEPLVELTAGRTWRLPAGQLGAVETDVLPDVAAGLGNERIYGQTGVVLRFGQGLASDYGAPRVSPGPSGGDVFKPTRPLVWYVFAGVDAQVVGRDIALNGNNFRDSASVTPYPLMGEAEAGFAIIAWGTRLTYTQVMQTKEFAYQRGGLHQLGSLALSMRF